MHKSRRPYSDDRRAITAQLRKRRLKSKHDEANKEREARRDARGMYWSSPFRTTPNGLAGVRCGCAAVIARAKNHIRHA